jgi:hypothetical protein
LQRIPFTPRSHVVFTTVLTKAYLSCSGALGTCSLLGAVISGQSLDPGLMLGLAGSLFFACYVSAFFIAPVWRMLIGPASKRFPRLHADQGRALSLTVPVLLIGAGVWALGHMWDTAADDGAIVMRLHGLFALLSAGAWSLHLRGKLRPAAAATSGGRSEGAAEQS